MAERTGIQWTDATWNPVRGCSRASEGCRHCYAEKIAARFSGPGQPYEGLADRSRAGSKWTGKVVLVPHMLRQPAAWRRPRRVFVNSMSDLFHETFGFGDVMRVWQAMWHSPHHVYQVLTKRAERMAEFVERWADWEEADPSPKLARGSAEVRAVHTCGRAMLFADMLDAMGEPPPGCAYPTYDWMDGMCRWPLSTPHIWLGFSAERQAEFDERWASVRRIAEAGWTVFVSAEPLLGAITLPPDFLALGRRTWVIVGGESGTGARPMRRAWAEALLRQCEDAGVPAWFKQAGAARGPDWPSGITGKGDDAAEWPESLRVQRFPDARGTMFGMLRAMEAGAADEPAEARDG